VAGYSGTPLAKKLTLKPGLRAWREGMPASVAAEIGDVGLILLDVPEAPIDAAHVFVTARSVLDERLLALPALLTPGSGHLWISWPKKASKVPTDVTEDVIRVLARGLGLIDVKVCAVDDIWSGLKLMMRKA